MAATLMPNVRAQAAARQGRRACSELLATGFGRRNRYFAYRILPSFIAIDHLFFNG
jgi:hypothetical protein